jgi:hypothetical protein
LMVWGWGHEVSAICFFHLNDAVACYCGAFV